MPVNGRKVQMGMSKKSKEKRESDTSEEHKKHAQHRLGFAVITLSSTRTKDEDTAGQTIKELAEGAGHNITQHYVVKDDKDEIKKIIETILGDKKTNVIVTNGGTGIAKKDVTIEAVKPFFEKEIASFNPLFAMLSYEAVGSAALVSRATAGIVKDKAIFCIPGSPRACRLAMEKLILPEAGHIIKHLGDK